MIKFKSCAEVDGYGGLGRLVGTQIGCGLGQLIVLGKQLEIDNPRK